MILRDHILKPLVTAPDSDHAYVTSHLAVASIGSDQVQRVLNQSDRNSNIVNLDKSCYMLVKDYILSWVEPVRCDLEKLPALFFKLKLVKLLISQRECWGLRYV